MVMKAYNTILLSIRNLFFIQIELCEDRMNDVMSGQEEKDLNSLAKWKRAKADGLLSWKLMKDKMSLVFGILFRLIFRAYYN